MRGKVTPELLKKMKHDRTQGATYVQIEQKYNVSRWVTIHYLKSIQVQQSVVDNLWKEAERKGEEYLKKNSFNHILNLNKISPQSHFDYYAEKDKDKWLIDVTINESKDLVAKSLKLVESFRCAILYVDHSLKNFKLVELKEVKK